MSMRVCPSITKGAAIEAFGEGRRRGQSVYYFLKIAATARNGCQTHASLHRSSFKKFGGNRTAKTVSSHIASLGMAVICAACGGGGNGTASSGDAAAPAIAPTPAASSPASSLGYLLPTVDGLPDVATLLGQDINNNGVRDEVEVAMARAIGNDLPTWKATIQLAQTYQSWLADPTTDRTTAQVRVLKALQAGKCLSNTSSRSAADLARLAGELRVRTFSTAARYKILRETYEAAGAFSVPTTLSAVCPTV